VIDMVARNTRVVLIAFFRFMVNFMCNYLSVAEL
jgi:hypothetical protein